jgi:hypothetical protein
MNKQVYEYHPIIGYRFIPNLQTRVQHESGGYLIKTNSLGFRSETEFNPQKTIDKKRILLFGDSYTAADGVSNKKRYSDLLMQLLPDTEIFNFGMPGTGTDQQYLIYQEYAKNIEHDLIMIVVLVENIRRITVRYRCYLNEKNEKVLFQKPYFDIQNNDLVLKNTPVDPAQIKIEDLPESEKNKVDVGGRFPAIRQVINKAGLKNLVQKVTKYQPLPEYKNNDYPWQLMKSLLLQWFSELKKPLLVIPLPLHQYIECESDYTHVTKRFEELNNIENLFLFNPIDELRKYPLEKRRNFRFEHDEHPSPFGHEALAHIFKPKIEELLKFI